MNNLEHSVIEKEIVNLPAGQIFRVGYVKKIDTLKKFADLNLDITKITELSGRTGVNYYNIEGVVPSMDKKPRENPYEWVVKNKIKRNKNNGNKYIQIATLNEGHSTKTVYIVKDPSKGKRQLTKEQFLSEYGEYLPASAKPKAVLNESTEEQKDQIKVMTINFDNIYRINNVGEKFFIEVK